MSIDSSDNKVDGKTKDALTAKEMISQSDLIENKTKLNSTIESPLRRSTEVLDSSFKEETIYDESDIQIIMHTIFMDNRHLFKKALPNKIIKIDIASKRLADVLENNETQIRGCRICEFTYEGSVNDHYDTKSHKKMRDELGLKVHEDLSLSPMILRSQPGSIEETLQKLRESAMKVKYRKLKQQMINESVSHDVAASQGKDITSASNKKKLQILSIELENKVISTITDYDSLSFKLNSLITIIARKRQEEQHLLRKLKIIPWVIEICKKISVCPK
jgi:hypothetical protein